MDANYAYAFFEALRSASYITDPQLRDDIIRELLFINKHVYPTGKTNSGKPTITEAEMAAANKVGRRQLTTNS